VRYGEWAAVIFASDCYITSDWLLGKRSTPRWFQSVPEFEGTSDRSGIAVLPGLPSDVTSFSLVHTQYALPIVKGTGGEQHRMGQVSLSQGRTNRITVRVEAADRSIIRHY
jgi:hypothetical protein